MVDGLPRAPSLFLLSKFGASDEIFGKVTPAKPNLDFGGPAGGSALERASPPIIGSDS